MTNVPAVGRKKRHRDSLKTYLRRFSIDPANWENTLHPTALHGAAASTQVQRCLRKIESVRPLRRVQNETQIRHFFNGSPGPANRWQYSDRNFMTRIGLPSHSRTRDIMVIIEHDGRFFSECQIYHAITSCVLYICEGVDDIRPTSRDCCRCTSSPYGGSSGVLDGWCDEQWSTATCVSVVMSLPHLTTLNAPQLQMYICKRDNSTQHLYWIFIPFH